MCNDSLTFETLETATTSKIRDNVIEHAAVHLGSKNSPSII